MNILGIETSCDETGIAIYSTEKQSIIAEKLFSQASKHAEYGGVVPELASRDHLIKIIPLIKLTLNEAKFEFSDLDDKLYNQIKKLLNNGLKVGNNSIFGLNDESLLSQIREISSEYAVRKTNLNDVFLWLTNN